MTANGDPKKYGAYSKEGDYSLNRLDDQKTVHIWLELAPADTPDDEWPPALCGWEGGETHPECNGANVIIKEGQKYCTSCGRAVCSFCMLLLGAS